MEEDWENIEKVSLPVAAAVNKWAGEDEEDDVKESWEDEEEEKKDEEKVEVVTKPKPKKTLAEKLAEKERQKQEEAERRQKEKEEAMTPEERIAEKLMQQKLQEESDLKLALETFGVAADNASGIDAMNPTDKAGFDELCEALSKKISSFKSREEFPVFVEDIIRNICASLNSFDLKKLKTTIDNLYLEKQKAEKGDKGKKSKGKGKAKLKMEGDNTQLSEYSAYGDYDDFDDFM